VASDCANFLLDLQDDGRDFRIIRLERIKTHLVDLISLLDSTRIHPDLKELRLRHNLLGVIKSKILYPRNNFIPVLA